MPRQQEQLALGPSFQPVDSTESNSSVKTVVVLQSNYLPWKGYFDLVHDADLFIFYDDLQYTKNDWRNRNVIKTTKGTEWITIPVGQNQNRLICEVSMSDHSWQNKHWTMLQSQYKHAPHFNWCRAFFEDVYLNRTWSNLSELNQFLIKRISSELLGNTSTAFADSREYTLEGKKQDRLLELLVQAGTTRYVSGPAARDYIEAERFADAGIELVWKDYSRYAEYLQLHPPFQHGVSIVDLLFNVGADAPRYIWGSAG